MGRAMVKSMGGVTGGAAFSGLPPGAAAELYELREEALTATATGAGVTGVARDAFRGAAARVIAGRRLGFGAAEGEYSAPAVLARAAALAAAGPPAAFTFAAPARPGRVRVYDRGVAGLTVAALAERGREVAASVEHALAPAAVTVSWQRSASRVSVINTLGVATSYERTVLALLVAAAMDGPDGGVEAWEAYSSSRDDGGWREAVARLITKGAWARRRAPLPAGEVRAILTPRAAARLVLPLQRALAAPTAEGRRLAITVPAAVGRVPAGITVYDDGLLDWAPLSCPVDDEGVPVRRVTVLGGPAAAGGDAGAAPAGIHSLETAARAGVEPDGHGFRNLLGWPPGPRCTNLVLSAARPPLPDPRRALGDGVIIDQIIGDDEANLLNGDFIWQVQLGFLVRRGEVAGRLPPCQVLGNAFTVMAAIERVGEDVAEGVAGIHAPTLLVGSLHLTNGGGF